MTKTPHEAKKHGARTRSGGTPRAERTTDGARDGVRVVVVGGAGAMGRIVVRDLMETAPPSTSVCIADFNEDAAVALAMSHASARVSASFCDVEDVKSTARLLRGAYAVINAAHHRFNLSVMKAALKAGLHYVDLGGLFHVTRQQLELHADFEEAGRLALLGMGAAPGITNVLARFGAEGLDEVHEIHCLVGNRDLTERPVTPLATSYSIQTILEEASEPAAVFTDGELRFVEPMSGVEEVVFPDPIGVVRPVRTLHSEVATLPDSFRDRGLREVSFRIAFPPELDEKLRFLRDIGMLSTDRVRVDKVKVAPRDVLVRVLSARPSPPRFEGVPREYENLRVVVRGRAAEQPVEVEVDCFTPGLPAWGLGVDVDTGCPPSIAVQMLARGEIDAVGVLPPERVIPPEPFFRELIARGMTIGLRRRP